MKTQKKVIVDINGMSKKEIMMHCNFEGYSKSTYYRALKRKTLKLTINS